MATSRNRKSPRLKGYDYSREGAYFVTICTRDRQALFGDVKNDIMQLNKVGGIAQNCWGNLPQHFPNVELDQFVIMPNHLHGILIIHHAPISVGTTHALSTKHVTKAAPNRLKPGSLGAVIGAFKSAVTRQWNSLLNQENGRLWQARYHDHIIRNERALNMIRAYIETNPARWGADRYYTQLCE